MYKGVKEQTSRNRNEWNVSLKEVQSERDVNNGTSPKLNLIQNYFKVNKEVV